MLESFISHLIYMIVATAGGVARYLDLYLRGKRTWKLAHLVASAAASGFSGYIFAQFFIIIGQPQWALVTAGVGGAMGLSSVDFIWDKLTRQTPKDAP